MKTEQLAKIPAMPANPVPRLDMDGDRRAKMQQFIDDLEEELCFDTAEFYKDLLKDDVKLEPTTWSFLGHEQAPVIDGKKQSKQSKKQEAKQANQAKRSKPTQQAQQAKQQAQQSEASQQSKHSKQSSKPSSKQSSKPKNDPVTRAPCPRTPPAPG